VKDGKLHYSHNYLKVQEFHVASLEAVTAGRHAFSVEFTPTAKSLKPDYADGDIAISIDGKKVGELTSIRMAGQYSAVTGYGLLIGRNTGTPVSHLYTPPFRFTGVLEKVTIEVGQEAQ
jgi:arylsulfatase